MAAKTPTRTETDTFGPIEVEADKYWGAQAQRSLGNFKIGWEKQPAPIIRALGIVKKAAAETNMALGKLDPALIAARPASTGAGGSDSSLPGMIGRVLGIALFCYIVYRIFRRRR